MNWFKKAYVDGEYWIDEDGRAWPADGDIGDKDHSAYVRDRILSEYVDMDSPEVAEIFGARYPTDEDLLKIGIPQESIDIILDRKDPREYAMKNWGWVRVADRFIQTWVLTSQILKNIANGLFEAFDRDVYTEKNFVLESMANNRIYENVPYQVIDQANPMGLRDYQDMTFAKSLNWYKKAQVNEGKVKVLPDGSFMVLGKNTKRGEPPWRISRLDKREMPRYHSVYDTYEDALAVYDYTKGEEKNVYELV